jgi:hypothetical protein
MTVIAILYLWSHPIFARMQLKRKCHPKFASMQWKLSQSTIIIRSTIKIGSACICLHTWSSGWAGYLCYLCEYLRYFSELFTQKNRTIIYGLRPMREDGCWTGSLTCTWGKWKENRLTPFPNWFWWLNWPIQIIGLTSLL